MKIKDLKIRTQLQLGFIVLLLFVIVLGFISHRMNNQLYEQTEIMYNHPLKVQSAVGLLRADVFAISSEMKDRFLKTDLSRIDFDMSQIEEYRKDFLLQIEILYSNYLGPVADIDSIKQALNIWIGLQTETSLLLKEGKFPEAVNRNTDFGIEEIQESILFGHIQKVKSFAKDTGDNLFKESTILTNTLNKHLFFLVIAILLLSLLVNFILLRNIRNPINELTIATRAFHNGDLNSRSKYALKNEFGILSASFNTLAESIQEKTEMDVKFTNLAEIMLSENDAKKFFQVTLRTLADYTNSQMAAIYLLNNDKQSFDHFESIGFDVNVRQSFSADFFDGEFGMAVSSRKVQHLKNIPESTIFQYNTVSGKFIPREIITIPIISHSEVIAIISLASLSCYTSASIRLIDDILITLGTRIEGILAYTKIKEYTSKLESQNKELESQKVELSTQSAELMEQNTELEMQKNQLNEVSRLKTNFLSNMSHELRTPLNSVIALSGVLNRRLANQISEEEYSYLSVIERNGKHLLELINDILDISRIEAGKEDIEVSKFDAKNLISEIVSMILPQAKQKHIDLRFIPDDHDNHIVSDSRKFLHIIQNLISNAVKFTDKGSVEITTECNNNFFAIKVSDTGIGIEEKHLPFIFDEFRQADGSTSRRFGGTGLGLAIAKKYANLLGGDISVKSTPEKGSEFTLTLPLHFNPSMKRIEKETDSGNKWPADIVLSEPSSSESLKTILLVEDNEPAIIQIKDFLEESGYQILIARDGTEALQKISLRIPDAMILDLMMPGIDGFGVLETLRNAEPTAQIPVLILTAKHITKEDLKFLKRNNVHQLIQKGAVSRTELLIALRSMVNTKTDIVQENTRQLPKVKKIQGKPKIMVVEDNPDNMLTVKVLLSDSYEVFEAVDGASSVELARTCKPDLVLMDIALPDMDGIEAFKIIRADARLQHIPVIALTASAMISDRETILSHGFDAYIAKPIEEAVFFKIINGLLYE
jgi:signal transduction histidine kinase/CheY-like chemotaxis protein/HAMP domain-containing protein